MSCRARVEATAWLAASLFSLLVALFVRGGVGRLPSAGTLEDHADDDLAVAVHLVEHAAAHAFVFEQPTDRSLQVDDEEVHFRKSICD